MSPADVALEAAQALAVEQGWTPIESLTIRERATEESGRRYLIIATLDGQRIALERDEVPGDDEARSLGRSFARSFGRGRGEAVQLLAKDRALAGEGGAR